MKGSLVLIATILCTGVVCWGQNQLLQSGPMVGYSTMKEVLLWVQTTESAAVQFSYWDQEQPHTKYLTKEINSQEDKAYVVKLIADRVEPGKHYSYRLTLNGSEVPLSYPLQFQTQTLWQWRTDPPAFSFALGSCNYVNEPQYDRPGKPYGGDYGIYQSIHKEDPDFMVWLGDNLYLREADWNSYTGIFHRYTYNRSLPEIQPLLGSVHHYAIWDDHDYGPNDSDRGYWNKQITSEAFKLFWGNPNYNLTGSGGITGTFMWEDVQFFLLDDRYFRAPNFDKDSTKALIGKAQMLWLKDLLTQSRASFKFICIGGQVLNPGAVYENYANYPVERSELLKVVRESGARGVIFFTGDRHHTELTKMEWEDYYPFYDLTVSPLTSSAHTPDADENSLSVPGTIFNQRNYGIIRISGPRTDRLLRMEIHDVAGKLIWQKSISARELQYPPRKD